VIAKARKDQHDDNLIFIDVGAGDNGTSCVRACVTSWMASWEGIGIMQNHSNEIMREWLKDSVQPELIAETGSSAS